jgi:hypothetical protein
MLLVEKEPHIKKEVKNEIIKILKLLTEVIEQEVC